jgi:mono/diheme cytochrome c family protein
VSLDLVIGIQLVVLGGALFAFSSTIARRWRQSSSYLAIARTSALVIGIAFVVSGGQTPMSNTANPVPNTVTSAEIGNGLYQANCAACHGADGRGGGPLSGTTKVMPPSLRAHLMQHSDGDLFYWISNGLPGGMPAWSQKLSEIDRWNIINFLRSINGQGPTPRPSSSMISVDRFALVLPGGYAAFVGGGLAVAFRRRRRARG